MANVRKKQKDVTPEPESPEVVAEEALEEDVEEIEEVEELEELEEAEDFEELEDEDDDEEDVLAYLDEEDPEPFDMTEEAEAAAEADGIDLEAEAEEAEEAAAATAAAAAAGAKEAKDAKGGKGAKGAKGGKGKAPQGEEKKGLAGKVIKSFKEDGEKARAEKKAKDERKAAYRRHRIEQIEEQRAKNIDGYNKAMAFAEAEEAEGFEYTSEDVYAATDRPTSVKSGERTQKMLKKKGLVTDAPKKVRSKTTYTMKENNLEGGVGAIDGIIAAQRDYYANGKSRSVEWRTKAMERLAKLIKTYEKPLVEALHRDLGISRSEAYLTEIAPLHEELRVLYANTSRWTGPRRQRFVFKMWKTKFVSHWQPLGTVCIINSWQSPVLAAVSTLATAVAAGNTVVLKNSSRTWRCNEVLASAITELFTPDFVRFIYGGDDVDEVLAVSDFDKIVYIGEADKAPMLRAGTAQTGAQLGLMLDGNNPVVVDGTFSITRAAERIMWGKMLHAGQTRISPSIVYVRQDAVKPLINEMFKYVRDHFGKEPIKAEGYPRMFAQEEYDEACELLDKLGSKAEIVVGGGRDDKRLRIEPTVILVDSIDHPLIKKRITGPILVVAPFSHTGHTFTKIIKMPTPPALYLFSSNNMTKKYVMQNVDFGSGCINDTMIQVANRFTSQESTGDAGGGALGGKHGVEAFGSHKTVAVSRKMTHDYRYVEPGDDYSKVKRWFHASVK